MDYHTIHAGEEYGYRDYPQKPEDSLNRATHQADRPDDLQPVAPSQPPSEPTRHRMGRVLIRRRFMISQTLVHA